MARVGESDRRLLRLLALLAPGGDPEEILAAGEILMPCLDSVAGLALFESFSPGVMPLGIAA